MGMHIKYVVTAVFLLSISLVHRMNRAALNEQLFSVSFSPHCSTCSPMPCSLFAVQTKFQGWNYFLRLLCCSSLKYLCKKVLCKHEPYFMPPLWVSELWCREIDSRLYANLRLLRPCILGHVISILWHYRGSLPCAGMPGTHSKWAVCVWWSALESWCHWFHWWHHWVQWHQPGQYSDLRSSV